MDGVDALLDLLAGGAGWFGADDDADPVDLLEHSLQCADLLAAAHPGDPELVAAGLFHDIGHLVGRAGPGGDDRHEDRGEELLAPLLGRRTARLVGLHVIAKRHLAVTDPAHRDLLSGGSRTSLARQGGGLDPAASARFASDPDHEAALALRRADDGAKEPGRPTSQLDRWRGPVALLARRNAS